MTSRGSRFLKQDGPRHSPDWYDQSSEDTVLADGDRMLIECEGGPSFTRLELFPPRLEIAERGGVYVLLDEDARSQWRYVFTAND